MRGIRRRIESGFMLPYVLVFAAILAAIAMMLLESANNASHSTYSIQDKNQIFDAAEAGLNAGLDDLDASLLTPTQRSATLPNGYTFSYTIYPNFILGHTITITDPITGSGNIVVPIGGAIIYSTGSDPNGTRSTTVEAAVTLDSTQLTYPHLEAAVGSDIQGSYGSRGITDSSGTNSASIHSNGNITASINGIQGTTSASGPIDSLPPGAINAPTVPLPTVSQFDYLIASYKSQAQTFGGPINLYEPAGTLLSASYTCPPAGALLGCLLFYDGPLTLSSKSVTFNGPWTMVVNGNLSETWRSVIAFSTKPNLLVVNGNAAFSGRSYVTGYVQVKGSTSISSTGVFTGAMMSLGSLTFSGGGTSGGLVYDPAVIPPSHALTGLVKIVTYAEY